MSAAQRRILETPGIGDAQAAQGPEVEGAGGHHSFVTARRSRGGFSGVPGSRFVGRQGGDGELGVGKADG